MWGRWHYLIGPGLAVLAGCASPSATEESGPTSAGPKADDVAAAEPTEDWSRDIISTDLALDLGARTGVATLLLAGSTSSSGASFEVDGLEIDAVRMLEVDLGFEVRDGHLHVAVPADSEPVELTVTYRFAAVSGTMNGWDPQRGVTFLWPYFCSNLFPCRSDPSEGSTFTLSVSGVPAGRAAVYPERIPADAPSYQPAIAVGRYTEDILGTTTAGTEVGLWFLPTGEGPAREGTRDLVEVFDFLEQTYGPYTFGPRVGSVAADWGGGDFGGMEHHPLWHVSTGSMRDPIVHAHEAAHGWYGDGVRIECWEDFVLSEGVTSYLAARALEEVGFDPWPSYGCQLRSVCTNDPPVVLPESATCSEIDILHHELWSTAPYMKGAFFLRAVAEQIGVEAVDEVLAAFYAEHVGRAATMDELIDALAQRSMPGEVESLADAWLRARACPIDANTLCR